MEEARGRTRGRGRETTEEKKGRVTEEEKKIEGEVVTEYPHIRVWSKARVPTVTKGI